MEKRKIQEIDTAQLRGWNSTGMRHGEWRLMPLHWDNHDDVTSWQIFELTPGKDNGDIDPICEDIPYWPGLEIVRAHNLALGLYKEET